MTYPVSLLNGQPVLKNIPGDILLEKVALITDREIYCVGEHLFFKAFNLSSEQIRSANWSRVLYVEMITPEGQPVFQGKFRYDTAGSTDSFVIPGDILTGNYYLRAYTKWMRNFSAYAYFYKVIQIINPFNRELLKSQSVTDLSPEKQRENLLRCNDFSVKTDKQVYNKREKVILTTALNKNGNQYRFFCVSVAQSGAENGISSSIPEDKKWQFHPDYIPEIRSISLTGKVLNQNDSTPVPYMHVSLSVISKIKNTLTTLTDKNGCFYFSIPEQEGEVELFISLKNPGNETGPVILVDNDFCSDEVKLPYIPFIQHESDEELFNELIFNSQIAMKYKKSRSPEKPADSVSSVPFYGLSFHSVKFSEYIPLPTMEDYLNEFLLNVVIRKKDRIKYFQVLGPYSELGIYEPLVLVDNVPVYNVDWILSINPRKVDRIEVIEKPYILGDICYGGLIHILSVDGDFAGVNLPSSGQFFNYMMYTPAEKENDGRLKNLRIPDARNTLYWNPEVQLTEGRSEEFTFFTADTPGKYIAIIKSMDAKGNEVRNSCSFVVE
jgi:hypothetical protein